MNDATYQWIIISLFGALAAVIGFGIKISIKEFWKGIKRREESTKNFVTEIVDSMKKETAEVKNLVVRNGEEIELLDLKQKGYAIAVDNLIKLTQELQGNQFQLNNLVDIQQGIIVEHAGRLKKLEQ